MEKALFDRDFANWCGNIFDDLCKFNPSKEDIQRLNVHGTPQQKTPAEFDKEFEEVSNIASSVINRDINVNSTSEPPIP